ncbi:MAG: hypothetical protein ACO25B_12570 [Chitinophagaceae bacterium]
MNSIPSLALMAITFVFCISSSAQNAAIPCPANMVVSADPGKEGAIVKFPAPDPGLGDVTITPASGSFFRLGSHSVIVTTASGKKCSFTVTVTDNEAPELSPVSLSREKIWPESNKMKKVSLRYSVTDNAGPAKITLTVSSNGTDGIQDWEIIDEHLVRLRSLRLPGDKPRIYSITVTATDAAGNKTKRTASIAVSKTMSRSDEK